MGWHMVNHFLLNNDELLNRFEFLLFEGLINSKEYYNVRKEILERLRQNE